MIFMPIRYADDFIVLVTTAGGDPELCRAAAEQEKSALGEMLLTELGLSLSPEKTLVTPVTSAIALPGTSSSRATASRK